MNAEEHSPWLTVVGLGEDGYDGLGSRAREAIGSARVLFGGARHLALIPEGVGPRERVAWKDLEQTVAAVLSRRGEAVTVLASGDPMHYGIGATLARHVPTREMAVLGVASAFSLAAARMGWPVQEVETLSVHGRDLHGLAARLYPGARLLVLSRDGTSPEAVARLITELGYGNSVMTVLERLGGPHERRREAAAAAWSGEPCEDLNTIALACVPDTPRAVLPSAPGLPDEAFAHDGQMTKREVRAATIAALTPWPGALLWDLGAGAGSVAVEWMRLHPRNRAVAVERAPERVERIRTNARRLGTPGLAVVEGCLPEVLADLEGRPDAVFIGGGLTRPGVAESAWERLQPGGRLVANAVTLAGEARLAALHAAWGGDMRRIGVSRAKPMGAGDLYGWEALAPVTQYAVLKPEAVP